MVWIFHRLIVTSFSEAGKCILPYFFQGFSRSRGRIYPHKVTKSRLFVPAPLPLRHPRGHALDEIAVRVAGQWTHALGLPGGIVARPFLASRFFQRLHGAMAQ